MVLATLTTRNRLANPTLALLKMRRGKSHIYLVQLVLGLKLDSWHQQMKFAAACSGLSMRKCPLRWLSGREREKLSQQLGVWAAACSCWWESGHVSPPCFSNVSDAPCWLLEGSLVMGPHSDLSCVVQPCRILSDSAFTELLFISLRFLQPSWHQVQRLREGGRKKVLCSNCNV